MLFVKIGEYRVDTKDLLYYYKEDTSYTLVYNINNSLTYIHIPITPETETGIKRLDNVLEVVGLS